MKAVALAVVLLQRCHASCSFLRNSKVDYPGCVPAESANKDCPACKGHTSLCWDHFRVTHPEQDLTINCEHIQSTGRVVPRERKMDGVLSPMSDCGVPTGPNAKALEILGLAEKPKAKRVRRLLQKLGA